jgi:hypothetical protein
MVVSSNRPSIDAFVRAVQGLKTPLYERNRFEIVNRQNSLQNAPEAFARELRNLIEDNGTEIPSLDFVKSQSSPKGSQQDAVQAFVKALKRLNNDAGGGLDSFEVPCSKRVEQEGDLLRLTTNEPIKQCTPHVEYQFIDTEEALEYMIQQDPVFSSSDLEYVAMDCEGVPDKLDLLQLGTATGVYLIDCDTIGARHVCQTLSEPLLQSNRVIKLLHDLRCDAQAIDRHGWVPDLSGVIDTQLVAESIWHQEPASIGLNGLLERLGLPMHPMKHLIRDIEGEDFWAQRPIPSEYLEYAALDVQLLYRSIEPLRTHLNPRQQLDEWIPESIARAKVAADIYLIQS